MNSIQIRHLTISLMPEAHQVAYQFAMKQETIEKSKQVYLNTLAVYAVRNFLEEILSATDLEPGDSWNPIINCFYNVADLVIPELGKLECLPVFEEQISVLLPKEVRENRIGYVVVEFREDLSKVQLLGFCRALPSGFTAESIQIYELEPIENLIAYLLRLEVVHDFLESEDSVAIKVREKLQTQTLQEMMAQLERIISIVEPDKQGYQIRSILGIKKEMEPVSFSFKRQNLEGGEASKVLEKLAEDLLNKLKVIFGLKTKVISENLQSLGTQVPIKNEKIQGARVKLSQWFENEFTEGWQLIQELIAPQFVPAFKSNEIKRVKDLGLEILGNKLALMIAISKLETGVGIQASVYPTGEQLTLPPNLKLMILNEQGVLFKEVIALNNDEFIRYKFEAETGDKFEVKVVLGGASISENFEV
jgi:hypothetical protein